MALAEGIAAAAGGREVSLSWLPGLLTVFFCASPPRDFAEAARCDTAAFGAWCRALLERGVYPPPSQFEAWFPSLALTDAQIEQTIEAARGAFEAIS